MSQLSKLLKWQPALYRHARKFVNQHRAEDVVQDTLISAWKTIKPEAWNSWGLLKTILMRRITDNFRKRHKLNDPLSVDPRTIDFDPSWGREDRLWEENYGDKVSAALLTLENNIRFTFLLVVEHDYTSYEAAEILGIPLNTVLSRLARAKNKLHALLA